MKHNKKSQIEVIGIVFFVILVATLLVLVLGIDTVESNHLGIQVRYGQIVGVQQPSMQWTGLFTDVFQYDMRTRKAEIILAGDNYAPSKDAQKIYATINVNYRLKRTPETVTALFSNIGNDDVADDRLNIPAIITEGFKQATSQYTAMESLEKRQELKEKSIDNIRNNFPKDYYEIENIIITNIAFSPEYANEIEKKQVAEISAQKEKNQLEVVKFQQQQSIEVYKAEAEKIKLQAQQLTDLTIKQAWISKWSGNLPQYLITSPENANFIMSLPTTPQTTG